jgi:chemotaxis protein CheX
MSQTLTASRTVDYINPVISATRNVFEMMLNCTPKRSGLMLKGDSCPKHEISAMIGVTGKVAGTIVVSFSREVAVEVLRRMVGIETTEITSDVCDAVGELTNMIAGGAKAQLEHLELSISIPNMVSGPDHRVHYPSEVKPICILFDSEIGQFMIEVGFTGIAG